MRCEPGEPACQLYYEAKTRRIGRFILLGDTASGFVYFFGQCIKTGIEFGVFSFQELRLKINRGVFGCARAFDEQGLAYIAPCREIIALAVVCEPGRKDHGKSLSYDQ